MKRRIATVASTLALLLGISVTPSSAATIVLDFEGLQDFEQILDFYNGGTGSFGSSGTDYGISFGTSALSIIDEDAGGSGNIANEPSPDTVAFFLSGGDLVMNVAAGFTSFSFFYSSSLATSVTLYDALNAGGNVLQTLDLASNALNGCPGDPNGEFACWDSISVNFAGTAFSVSFAGAANQVAFDDITLGSSTPRQVPEPASMLLLGVGGAAAAWRRRRTAGASSATPHTR